MQISNMGTQSFLKLNFAIDMKECPSSNYLNIIYSIHTATTHKRGILSQLSSISNHCNSPGLRSQHWRRCEDALQATAVVIRWTFQTGRDSPTPQRCRGRRLAGQQCWGGHGRRCCLENGSSEKTHLGVGGWLGWVRIADHRFNCVREREREREREIERWIVSPWDSIIEITGKMHGKAPKSSSSKDPGS